MINLISRKDICKELDIDDYVLSQYEAFLELPKPKDDSYDVNIAKLIARLHEFICSGLTLNDIRHLSLCADQYSHLIPSLRTFRDFSPQHHLKELVIYYNEMMQDMSGREHHYHSRIQELESILEAMQVELEKNGIAVDQVQTYQMEKERYRLELEDRIKQLEKMQLQFNQQEVELHELRYQNDKKDYELEKLRAEIEFYASQDSAMLQKKSAIDIQALMKKKEKEIALKYQREIFDLKKQVDMLVEKKEQEWSSRNIMPPKASK